MKIRVPHDKLYSQPRPFVTWLAVIVVCLAGSITSGQTSVYWDTNGSTSGAGGGSTPTGTWNQNSTSNWTTNSGGTATTSTWQTRSGGNGVAVFAAGTNATGSYTVTVSGTITGLTGLNFQEGAVTLTGSTLSPGTSGIVNNTALLQTINSNIDLNGNQTWNMAGGGGLTVGGALTFDQNLTLSGSGAIAVNGITTTSGTRTLTNNNSGGATFGDVTVGGTLNVAGSGSTSFTGAFNLGGGNRTLNITSSGLTTISGTLDNSYYANTTKSGSGTLVLSGNNSGWDGPLLITGGTVQIEHASALGSTTYGNSISSGATLALNHTTGITLTEGSFSLSGTGDGDNGAIRSVSGNNTINAQLNFAGDTTLQSDAGTLTLGTLEAAANAITLAGDGNIAATSVGNGGNLILSGGGDRSFTGAVNLNSNTLTVGSTGTNTFGGDVTATGGMTLSGGATTFSGSQVNAGSGIIDVTTPGSVTFNSVVQAGTLNLNGTGTTTLGGSGGNNITTTNFNAGTLVLAKSGANALSGTVTVGDGTGIDTLRLDASNQISDSSDVILSTSGVFNLNGFSDKIASLELTGGSVATGAGTLSLDTLTTNASASSASISGNLQITAYSNTFAVADGAAAQDLVISANLTGEDSENRLIKTGSGTLVLSGTNTFADSGNTWDSAVQVQGGTLIVSADANLGAANNNVSLSSGTTLQFDGSTNTGSNRLLKLGGAATVNVGSAYNVTWAGGLDGSGNLTKAGTGSLALSGNSGSYTGNVVVNAGTLAVSHSGALGAGGSTTVNSGSTLSLSGGITLNESSYSFAGTGVGGGGAVRNISGNNVLDGGTFSLTADTTITSVAGKLDIGDAGSGADPFNIGAHALTLNAATGTIQLNTPLTGSGNVIKDGTGTLIYYMLGNGSHTGTTTIKNGTMLLDTVFDANNGINGPLVIGDNVGSAQTAILRLGQAPGGSSYNLINDATNVTINTDGLFDTRGYHETINNLVLNGGAVIGSSVLDRLDVAGTISNTNTSQAGSISGLLGLNNDMTKSISVSSNSTLNISAKISNGGIVKTGTGTLNLSGDNSFTGNVTISQGILNASSNFALGNFAGSSTTVQSGAQLQLQGGITVSNENLVLNGTGISTNGALRNVSGANTWNGSVNIATNSRMETAGGSLTVNGGISSAGRTLTVAGAGNTTFNGTVGLGALVKQGTGTLTVTNTNTYSAATVSAGSFTLGASNILLDSMDVTVAAGATFNVNTRTETIDDLNGAGTLALASGGALTVDHLGDSGAFTGTFDLASGSTLTLNNGLIGTGANGVGAGGTMILAGSGTLQITDDFRFDGTLQMSTGTLLLTNTGTQFDLGTLHITGNSVLDFSNADITTLNLGSLIIDVGAKIDVVGWTYDVDFWSSGIWAGAARDHQGDDPTTRVTFNGYSNLETIWLTTGNEITVPEPSTYGAILIGSGLAAFLWRKRRQRRAS